ncbi:hypothetical protein OCO53_22390 [Peribacillus frigoritolerans]|uniref:hypothetical protein n=1 Tax=Peribacillus frigoritolerans TaxID=450367 RepID=UPI0021D20670|nr:hypothetical protein [Peribacillus frigoritolerans]MCU6603193.1 hypothetical protein [Peribacillus frigoritolerans]
MSRGDPAGASRGGSPTARGKRVPEAKINIQIVQAIKKLQTNTIFIELLTVWVLQHDETPLKMI